MTPTRRSYEVFRRLHESGCFVIPNPWDAGSARVLVQLGFPALATTSSGFAWSMGRPDNGVTLDEALDHFRAIAASVDVPVNGDFEGGFAIEPAGVATNVTRAVATGIAGSRSKIRPGRANPLFDFDLSVERIHAARQAIDRQRDASAPHRPLGRLHRRPPGSERDDSPHHRVRRGRRRLSVCAGIRNHDDIIAVVKAVAPKPVNVLVGATSRRSKQLAKMGVRRISVGGALARAAWTGFLTAATEIAKQGTFKTLGEAVPFAEIDRRFK